MNYKYVLNVIDVIGCKNVLKIGTVSGVRIADLHDKYFLFNYFHERCLGVIPLISTTAITAMRRLIGSGTRL